MQKIFFSTAICSTILLAFPFAQAKLPEITEKPWLGYFLGIKDRKFQFGMTSKGDTIIEPLKRNGKPVNIHNPVKVHFEILETMPDGKVVSKKIDEETLTSNSPAILDPEKPIVISGKATGNSAFEVAIIPGSGELSLTGKITDKGTLTNPLSFVITLDFSPYKVNKMDEDQKEKFIKKIRRDEIRAELIGGGNARMEFEDEGNNAILHPKGFSALEIKTEGYDGVDFEFKASENSKIILENKGDRPLYKGFSIRWMVNEGADPGKERLTFEAS